jgi:hypothetical protein
MGGGYEDSLKMDPEGMGIIPRIVQEIFLTIADKEKYKYKTHVSYLEVHMMGLLNMLSNLLIGLKLSVYSVHVL